MSKIDHSVSAATQRKTLRAADEAVRHFEDVWGGSLPATADNVAQYLADHAETLSQYSLKMRLAGLSQWHLDRGFDDPTKAPLVKTVLKGIGRLHPDAGLQARPMQLSELERLVQWLEERIRQAAALNDRKQLLTFTRDKALLLIGFWRGIRSDELSRLCVEDMQVLPGLGLKIFLHHSEGDGRLYRVPALQRLCPVEAYQDWVRLAGITRGPVFRGVSRRGQMTDEALPGMRITAIVRQVCEKAGLQNIEMNSGHSLRGGFACWADPDRWEIKPLMEQVGWKEVRSTMRYADTPDPFFQRRIEGMFDRSEALTATRLEIFLGFERIHSRARGMMNTLENIERSCLANHAPEILEPDRSKYGVQICHKSPEALDELLHELIQKMHRIASESHCMLHILIEDPATGRIWS